MCTHFSSTSAWNSTGPIGLLSFCLKFHSFLLRLSTKKIKNSFFLRLAQLYTDRWYNQERVKIICDATPTARRQFKALNIMYVSVNMKWTPNINSAIRPKKKCLSSDPIFGAPTQIFFVILPKNLKNWHRAAFHTSFSQPQQVAKSSWCCVETYHKSTS